MKRAWGFVLIAACGDTGQEHVELPLSATGTAAHPVAVGDATIELTRADVAFGPMYSCASEAGRAELCEVATAEFLETATVHALDPSEQPLGTLNATTGSVRSALFDYGISWLLTENAPRANRGAPEGHSAILEGTVTRGAARVRFSVIIDAAPRMGGDLTVNGQQTRFDIQSGNNALNMTADPHAWISNLDVDALFALDADGDGTVAIPADSVLHESILQGMVSRAPLRFQWR
ncbi:MAG TPA: hypothetical protein VI299_03605 [Polyangiales bacterium]